MQAFVAFLYRLVHDEEGQDMVEYALILGLVSIVAVIAVTATGTAIKSIWEAVQAAVESAVAGTAGETDRQVTLEQRRELWGDVSTLQRLARSAT